MKKYPKMKSVKEKMDKELTKKRKGSAAMGAMKDGYATKNKEFAKLIKAGGFPC
jgi:hypothetical protein